MASSRRDRSTRFRRVTIQDVAARAGVSPTTVSHALNGKGRIDPATRERVFAAAERLGYRASRTARALRTRRTGAIAFFVPSFERPPTQTQMLTLDIYMNQASAAARAAFARDHSLLLIPPITTAGELDGLGVDGGIVCDPLRDDPVVELFEQLELPVVTIERQPGRPESVWHVRADNEGDTLRLLEHLAQAGAERIAMLSLDADMAWTHETTSAYREWCTGRGREPVVLFASPHQLESSAFEMTRRLLECDDPPDAIFASAERFASGVIRAARERGRRIPEDLMVATGIDGWEAREATPPVTAIDVQPALQGAAAADLLISRIEAEEVEAPRITPSHLHLRASTRAVTPA
ncbi:MAG: LacI family DNA-binding transcriptional regulator [Thermoleophilaceae bacterium]